MLFKSTTLGTNFVFSFQMADDQDCVEKQGAGDSESQDVVDAKPDRSSFISTLLR